MKRIFRSLAALLIIVISFSAISFAWLASGKYLNFPSSFGGSATPAYFAGGDGSKDNPFRITKAVHLYNLAWLQYLGYFNRREGFNNDRDQTYFELGKDVDMRGRAIPPIGTEEYPFIGEFKGNGHKVTNLTISNKKGTGDLVYSPTNANFSSGNMLCRVNDSTKTQEIEIVGMFGVTGDYDGYFNRYRADGHTVDGTIASVSNFYVDKIHVRSNSAKTLAGLAAGYIGGNFSNVGVYRSDIKFAANAQANGVAGEGVLSKYSLVGAYNEDLVNWSDGAIGFGNSIGIKSLYERVEFFCNNKTDTTSISNANFNYYYDINKGSIYARKVGDNYYIYGGEKVQSQSGTTIGATYNIDGSHPQKPAYLPIKTKSDTDYTVADDNTGYMASGPFVSGGDIRVRSTAIDNKNYGLSVSTNSAPKFDKDGKNVEILTITKKTYNENHPVQRIEDDYNKGNTNIHTTINNINYPKETYSNLGLEAYSTARDKFNDNIKGQGNWYGFHFMKAAIGIGTNNIYTAPKATINGVTYTNYQMTADSIDFKTKTKGHIAFFAGSNYTPTAIKNFFSLHEIVRDANDPCAISEIREISKIYSSGDDYVYLYKDGGVSAGEVSDLNDENLEFDCGWINNTKGNGYMVTNAIYYFEIPVNKGEFALGSVSTGDGGYLLYLDIGANGNQTPTGGYTMDKVRFVNYSGIPSDGNGNVNVLSAYKPALITLSGSSTAEEIAVFKRDDTVDATVGNYILRYRVNYLAANEITTGMTKLKPDLEPSTDDEP